MSRIYEALQKAESERKSERREPELRIPDQPVSAASTAAVAESEDAAFATPRFSRGADRHRALSRSRPLRANESGSRST